MGMAKHITGIHHVTAMAGDPQTNIDFYAGVLGLRLVKLTVNYDDPGTYHLYYGDYSGQPGTILTFFPWKDIPKGRAGAGQVTITSFSVPAGSYSYWTDRLAGRGIDYEGPEARFGERALSFRDPDGMAVELIEAEDARTGWKSGPVPKAAAIRGFHSATLAVARLDATARLLTDVMGFEEIGPEGNRRRFQAGDGRPHQIVDLIETPRERRGFQGAGSVHHIAWRVPSDQEQAEWRTDLVSKGYQVSPVTDRKYFHSIYYREPSGILFEIATDPPGFTVDEPLDTLGQTLVLPAWLEPSRKELALILPKLDRLEVQHA
jgi:glyoxalase family protein